MFAYNAERKWMTDTQEKFIEFLNKYLNTQKKYVNTSIVFKIHFNKCI